VFFDRFSDGRLCAAFRCAVPAEIPRALARFAATRLSRLLEESLHRQPALLSWLVNFERERCRENERPFADAIALLTYRGSWFSLGSLLHGNGQACRRLQVFWCFQRAQLTDAIGVQLSSARGPRSRWTGSRAYCFIGILLGFLRVRFSSFVAKTRSASDARSPLGPLRCGLRRRFFQNSSLRLPALRCCAPANAASALCCASASCRVRSGGILPPGFVIAADIQSPACSGIIQAAASVPKIA